MKVIEAITGNCMRKKEENKPLTAAFASRAVVSLCFVIRGDECELSGGDSRKRRETDSTLSAANLNVLAAVSAVRQTATFGCGSNAAFSELRLPSAVHPQKNTVVRHLARKGTRLAAS